MHSEGTRSDGGVLWEYLHDGSGIVKITEVVDKQHVKGTTVTRLPDAIKSGTVCWELGMLHKASKYPKSGAFFRNRFAFLVNTETGPNVCLSYSGDYNNFADMECGEATAETAITVPVLNTEFNEGKWIYARDVLFVGTGASEFYVDVVSSASPLASDNVKTVSYPPLDVYKRQKIPTAEQIDNMLVDAKATPASTYIFCHPKVLSMLNKYKGNVLQTMTGDMDVNRSFAAWNGICFITSYNFKNGEEDAVKLA